MIANIYQDVSNLNWSNFLSVSKTLLWWVLSRPRHSDMQLTGLGVEQYVGLLFLSHDKSRFAAANHLTVVAISKLTCICVSNSLSIDWCHRKH